jgi:integrase
VTNHTASEFGALGSTKGKTGEKQGANGWEELLPLLDPAVVNAPHIKDAWKRVDRKLVVHLVNTVAEFPWLDHLALASIVYSEDGIAHPATPARFLHPFLRWAIPDHYPDVSSLEPEEAIIAYYGDPPQYRGVNACSSYGSLQLHMQAYLQMLTAEERTVLAPFLFPTLINTPRLTKLNIYVTDRSEANRKEQAYAVVRELPTLVALGRQRYRWLAALDVQAQQTAKSVREKRVSLPAIIKCKCLGNQQELTFRVWNRISWIKAHRESYNKEALYRKTTVDDILFLQLVGDPPDASWFLRALGLGILVSPLPTEAEKYLQDWNLPRLARLCAGLLRPSPAVGRMLGTARKAAEGTSEDSRILFCVEPVLAAAAVGLFTLVCLVQTGMRIGELMQVTLDRECMETGTLPRFDDRTGTWMQSQQRLYWRLYPKGRENRERYLVTPQMLEAMFILIELHKRFYGEDSIQPVPPRQSGFAHSRRFSGKRKFVLQWGGRQMSFGAIGNCLEFLLLEHPCRDQDGRPVRITSHLLRHGVAGWLRNQGIPLEDIMALLKQVNITVTDYYSKLSPQDLYEKIGPALTTLAKLAETDLSAIRTVGDIQELSQEALKRYGVLRYTPGGTCAVFTPCEVQFKCASCPAYVPDPDRRSEVREKIANQSKVIQLLREMGEYLQADVEKAHLRDWERVETEMDALDMVELVSPPARTVLDDLGLDSLGEELLQTLNPPQLPSGDS